jgi:hypothetical protein
VAEGEKNGGKRDRMKNGESGSRAGEESKKWQREIEGETKKELRWEGQRKECRRKRRRKKRALESPKRGNSKYIVGSGAGVGGE